MQDTVTPRKPFSDDRVLLLILSFLSLYIEIMLIRHLASEIRIFAYFKNLALIGAFLGLGFGYLYRPKICLSVTVICVAVIALLTNPASNFASISELLNVGGFNTWSETGYSGWLPFISGLVMLVALFFVIMAAMVPMGQALAQIFDRSKNRILDYSINIIGSILGVWFFAIISFATLKPFTWYLTAMAIILAVWSWSRAKTIMIATLIAIVGISFTHAETRARGMEIWSPYQKINFSKEIFSYADIDGAKRVDYYSLQTNHTIYMYLLDLSDPLRQKHPRLFPKWRDRYSYYDFPYNFPKRLDGALVLGAGGGNDVAAALRAGVKHVTALEIDPVIISLGKRYHPEKPYLSDRVTIINNDARNYLRNSDDKYDLIVLGLLDSHTLTSNFSNTNLDSYMYTLQSVGDMKRHLKDDGVLALSFQVTFPWIGSKIHKMVERQFGEDPFVFYFPSDRFFIRGTGGTYFIASRDSALLNERISGDKIIKGLAEHSRKMKTLFKETPSKVQTDDWPYLYVKTSSIPELHLTVSVLLVGIFVFVYIYFFGAPRKEDFHFASLGAGFLLLEVSVISRFTLFWGSTWIVSSIVISLILIAILIANILYLWRTRRAPYTAIYAALGVALAVAYFTPLESNLVALLYLVPFTIIGYLFARSFAQAQVARRALAYNLFGALVGGLSESVSYITGLSSLILIAMGFYALSFVFLHDRA